MLVVRMHSLLTERQTLVDTGFEREPLLSLFRIQVNTGWQLDDLI